MRDAFVRVLAAEMERDGRIVLITGDLGFGVLRQIHRRFPDRLINAGIAEQGMVSMAAGLATTGRTVLVYSIGNFPVLRPLEQPIVFQKGFLLKRGRQPSPGVNKLIKFVKETVAELQNS